MSAASLGPTKKRNSSTSAIPLPITVTTRSRSISRFRVATAEGAQEPQGFKVRKSDPLDIYVNRFQSKHTTSMQRSKNITQNLAFAAKSVETCGIEGAPSKQYLFYDPVVLEATLTFINSQYLWDIKLAFQYLPIIIGLLSESDCVSSCLDSLQQICGCLLNNIIIASEYRSVIGTDISGEERKIHAVKIRSFLRAPLFLLIPVYLGQMKLENQSDIEKPTFLERLLNLPLFIFEDIVSNLDLKSFRILLLLDNDLRDRCLLASRMIVYRPKKIYILDNNIIFTCDREGVFLTEEEVRYSKYKVVTPCVSLETLTDDDVRKMSAVFGKRVAAKRLSIKAVQCDIGKVAQLTKELKVTALSIGPNRFKYVDGYDFPKELIFHPAMKQIEELTAQLTFNQYPLDPFMSKNFKVLYLNFDEGNAAIFAKILNQIIQEWLTGDRVIQHYSLLNERCAGHYNSRQDHLDTLLKGWKIVSEDEEKHYADRLPLAVSYYSYWLEGGKEYKLRGFNGETLGLFISMHGIELVKNYD